MKYWSRGGESAEGRCSAGGSFAQGWRALRLGRVEGVQGVRWKSHGHSRGHWRALGGFVQSSNALGPVQEQGGILRQDRSFAGAEKGPGSD